VARRSKPNRLSDEADVEAADLIPRRGGDPRL